MKKIIVAFDSFKGCLTATEACHAAASGILACYPEAEVVCLPVSDGGEGLVACISELLPVTPIEVKVHNALMASITAHYAISRDGKTAFLEMAEACGLSLIPTHLRNPWLATTYGVGELIWDAVNRNCKHIVMGIGGSATTDGGKGMIDFLRPYLPLPVTITVACDVSNPLYGLEGAAYVYAPQKGATPEQVKLLDERLRKFAANAIHEGVATPESAFVAGAGAAGGLGYGLMTYLHATMLSGIDLMLDIAQFNQLIVGADIILTGEGKSDKQTLMGKVPMGILLRAQQQNIPVHLISGAIQDESALLNVGFASATSINAHDPRPLNILLQKEVATANLKKTVEALLKTHADCSFN